MSANLGNKCSFRNTELPRGSPVHASDNGAPAAVCSLGPESAPGLELRKQQAGSLPSRNLRRSASQTEC